MAVTTVTTLHDNAGCVITAQETTTSITYLTMTGVYGEFSSTVEAVMFPRELRALAIALLQAAARAEGELA